MHDIQELLNHDRGHSENAFEDVLDDTLKMVSVLQRDDLD